MCQQRIIQMLNLSEWRPLRIINFTIQNKSARFLYFRPLKIDKLTKVVKKDPIFPGRTLTYLEQPKDTIDELVLSWFKKIDPQAELAQRLLSVSTEEEDLRRLYNGLQSAKVTVLINPTPSSMDLAYLSRYEHEQFQSYRKTFNIRVIGHLDPSILFPITDSYHLEYASNVRDLFDLMATDIIPLD